MAGETMFRAVVFDVDGVLTAIDSIWRYLHERFGTWQVARKHYEMFHRGEISYDEWARLDAGLWRGISLNELLRAISEVPIRRGAQEAVKYFKKKGLEVYAISAGLNIITDRVREELGLDYAVANKLVVENGVITGEVEVVVSYNNKGDVLRKICTKRGIAPSEVIAVGDSEVDIGLFRQAGSSIAFNPTSMNVIHAAKASIFSESLLSMVKLVEGLRLI